MVSRPLIAVVAMVTAMGSLVGCSRGTAAQSQSTTPPPGNSWSLAYDAEFHGTALDPAKLTPCFDWNNGDCTSSFNNGREHYLPSQVQISDGVAHLVAEPLNPPRHDAACFQDVCTYKSGLLSTARPSPAQPYLFTFKYGYVEARMKLPTTRGMFTAFWMVPANKDYKYDYEIDAVENISGIPNIIYQNYAYAGRQKYYKVNDPILNTRGKCADKNYANDFHNYGMDWEPGYVAFYIDGDECGRFTSTVPGQIADQPMQIIIDLMVDTIWQRNIGYTLTDPTATDHLDVAYLKVWQPKR
ncbi:family 16 glycosylhydrolase [Skermania sp. ID1734]|uniref:glycoside hydrolase family 16 protein n=1 Tax=Skermania sp. ID1734 TaxID=2597516 RepID=UPI00163D71B8|nr:glycoside hydrolase family 16 protein [Skermania sp. ID1734]